MASYKKCVCDWAQRESEDKINDLNRVIRLILETNPHYSTEINGWLNNSTDYLQTFNQLLGNWDQKGWLDLPCIDCKYTINKKNNRQEGAPVKSQEDSGSCKKSGDNLDILSEAFGAMQLEDSDGVSPLTE